MLYPCVPFTVRSTTSENGGSGRRCGEEGFTSSMSILFLKIPSSIRGASAREPIGSGLVGDQVDRGSPTIGVFQ